MIPSAEGTEGTRKIGQGGRVARKRRDGRGVTGRKREGVEDEQRGMEEKIKQHTESEISPIVR